MPHYFFDVRDGVTTLDDTGTDLPDFEAARKIGIEILSRLTRQFPSDGSVVEHEIVVRENSKRVFKAILTFRGVTLD